MKTSDFVRLYKEGKIQDTTLIKMAAFKEQLEQMSDEKFQKIASKLPILLGAGLAGIGVGLGTAAYDRHLQNQVMEETMEQADKVFEELLQDPDFQGYDRELLEEYFQSIYHMSPVVATDKVAAKAYLLNMLAYSGSGTGVAIPTLETLTNIERNKRQAEKHLAESVGLDDRAVLPLRNLTEVRPVHFLGE